MATLTDVQKLFIVRALACFDTPTQVAQAVQEEFGIEIHRRQVAEYDPSKASGRDVGAKLKAVFNATRAEFLEDVAAVPIANLSVRLRILQRMVVEADQRGNSAMVARLLEQAAKEVGGLMTNRRELTGKGGGPIEQTGTGTIMTLSEFYEAARKVATEV